MKDNMSADNDFNFTSPESEVKINVLMISPKYDSSTLITSRWMHDLYILLRDHPKIGIVGLFNWDSSVSKIMEVLKRNRFDLILYFGHGWKSGWLLNPLAPFRMKKLARAFKGTIIYTLACRSLENFGILTVENGARAYLGYDEDVYTTSNRLERNYLDDFQRIIFNEIMGLLGGNSVQEVFVEALREWEELLREYNRINLPSAAANFHYAYINQRAHGFVGDPDARLSGVEVDYFDEA